VVMQFPRSCTSKEVGMVKFTHLLFPLHFATLLALSA
jgi:hypothetical protein